MYPREISHLTTKSLQLTSVAWDAILLSPYSKPSLASWRTARETWISSWCQGIWSFMASLWTMTTLKKATTAYLSRQSTLSLKLSPSTSLTLRSYQAWETTIPSTTTSESPKLIELSTMASYITLGSLSSLVTKTLLMTLNPPCSKAVTIE